MIPIFSASRREDMPAFHFTELMDKYRKYPEESFWILWTKNPFNIISSGMDFKRVALQLTITGIGSSKLEPYVPKSDKIWEYVNHLLCAGFNPKLINWRLDPIIPDIITPDMVRSLAKQAADCGITRCITSFVT